MDESMGYNPFTPPPLHSSTRPPDHTPTGIRTPVAALRTQNPRPLDDGGKTATHCTLQEPELLSPPDVRRQTTRAGNRVRTGDLHVGNVTLYQLSYSRILNKSSRFFESTLICQTPSRGIEPRSPP